MFHCENWNKTSQTTCNIRSNQRPTFCRQFVTSAAAETGLLLQTTSSSKQNSLQSKHWTNAKSFCVEAKAWAQQFPGLQKGPRNVNVYFFSKCPRKAGLPELLHQHWWLLGVETKKERANGPDRNASGGVKEAHRTELRWTSHAQLFLTLRNVPSSDLCSLLPTKLCLT